MDWKTAALTFGTIFLAELGDKTQLGVFGLASSNASRVSVFVGASAALIASTAIAVLAGDLVTQAISPQWLQRGTGGLFIVLGIVFLVRV